MTRSRCFLCLYSKQEVCFISDSAALSYNI
nr:MAG TPA: hypothetical protein [Caudoviricetes sp.]